MPMLGTCRLVRRALMIAAAVGLVIGAGEALLPRYMPAEARPWIVGALSGAISVLIFNFVALRKRRTAADIIPGSAGNSNEHHVA